MSYRKVETLCDEKLINVSGVTLLDGKKAYFFHVCEPADSYDQVRTR